MRSTLLALIPLALASRRKLQCVAFSGRLVAAISTTLAFTASGSGALPGFFDLSFLSPSIPASRYRFGQFQTDVFDAFASRMIALTLRPSAVSRTIRARLAIFCGVLPFDAKASSAARSLRVSLISCVVRAIRTLNHIRRQIQMSAAEH